MLTMLKGIAGVLAVLRTRGISRMRTPRVQPSQVLFVAEADGIGGMRSPTMTGDAVSVDGALRCGQNAVGEGYVREEEHGRERVVFTDDRLPEKLQAFLFD